MPWTRWAPWSTVQCALRCVASTSHNRRRPLQHPSCPLQPCPKIIIIIMAGRRNAPNVSWIESILESIFIQCVLMDPLGHVEWMDGWMDRSRSKLIREHSSALWFCSHRASHGESSSACVLWCLCVCKVGVCKHGLARLLHCFEGKEESSSHSLPCSTHWRMPSSSMHFALARESSQKWEKAVFN